MVEWASACDLSLGRLSPAGDPAMPGAAVTNSFQNSDVDGDAVLRLASIHHPPHRRSSRRRAPRRTLASAGSLPVPFLDQVSPPIPHFTSSMPTGALITSTLAASRSYFNL